MSSKEELGAKADFTAAIAVEPTNDGAFVDRATIDLDLSETKQAIADCNEALRLNPRRAEAYVDRGDAYARDNQMEASLSDYAAAIKLQPNFEGALSHRAQTLLYHRRPRDALADIEALLKLEPAESYVYYLKGIALKHLGQFAAADQAYRQGGQIPSSVFSNSAAWFYATCPEAHLRDPRRATDFAERACEIGGWNVANYRDSLAAAYAAAGDFPRAIFHQTIAILLEEDGPERERRKERLRLYHHNRPYVETAPAAAAP